MTRANGCPAAGRRVLVVTHGGVLQAVHLHARGGMYPGKMLNGSLNTVHIEGGKWAITTWNDAGYLQAAGCAAAGFGGGAGEA